MNTGLDTSGKKESNNHKSVDGASKKTDMWQYSASAQYENQKPRLHEQK